ncbi:MAG: glycerol-3-phosphate dehydrogenase/oxidase [Leptospiraceae bacterium]|nr:glycerol-3-phosphate dehydrogenase/oxidase [Leptospiraceae bacterium]
MNIRTSVSKTSRETGSRQRERSEIRARYDLVIIGGGISGATLLWDAALRGVPALLLEKNDYASGTSQATSKLIHGGLRYLKNGELRLVRESLRERRVLATIAPHAVRPEPFLYPIYRTSKVGRFMMGVALRVYDLLGFDRNRGLSPELKLPRARFLNRKQTIQAEPGIHTDGLIGAYIYYDYANVNPERLCAEFILSARQRGAHARNYSPVEKVRREPNGLYRITIRDSATGRLHTTLARTVVNAAGPWADYLDRKVTGRIEKNLIRSKGIHLVTRQINREHTVVLFRPDGTHMFIIPWRGKSILGTTDTQFHQHPDRMRVTEADARAVIADVNRMYPAARLSIEDVEYFYGGLRPLVEDGAASGTYNASRKQEILDHAESGYPGFYTVIGGKYTTSRLLAEKTMDLVSRYLPGKFGPCRTDREPLPAGNFRNQDELIARLKHEFPELPEEPIRTLSDRYGANARMILVNMRPGPKHRNNSVESQNAWQLKNGETYYPEEIDYVIQREDIHTIEDLYFRRAGLGTIGPVPESLNKLIVHRMGLLCGWTRKQMQWARQSIRNRYQLAPAR